MSVFITNKETQHFRNFVIVFAVCATIGGSVLVGRMIGSPLTATLLHVAGVATPVATEPPSETVFPTPRVITWDGTVFGILAGGEGLAVRRSDGVLFQAYEAEGQIASVSEGPIRITGRWTGTSCAYQNTVFGGRCTPSVEIDSLEVLPISLQ